LLLTAKWARVELSMTAINQAIADRCAAPARYPEHRFHDQARIVQVLNLTPGQMIAEPTAQRESYVA
jgi:hypothetical protein